MSLAQTNFDRAVASGHVTLRGLADTRRQLNLDQVSTDALRTIAWDLEAIQAAVRMELNNRMAGPDSMDLG